MVFQNYALYPHLSVRGNLGFGLRLRRVDKVARAQRVKEVAEVLGLTELLDRRPGALSGGQRQRVAMGRASCASPRPSSSTSRSPTSTPSCASRCAPS
jgi:multiple sugar transport system ATP-binding protein